MSNFGRKQRRQSQRAEAKILTSEIASWTPEERDRVRQELARRIATELLSKGATESEAKEAAARRAYAAIPGSDREQRA